MMSVIPFGHAHGDADWLAHPINEVDLYRPSLTRVALIGGGPRRPAELGLVT